MPLYTNGPAAAVPVVSEDTVAATQPSLLDDLICTIKTHDRLRTSATVPVPMAPVLSIPSGNPESEARGLRVCVLQNQLCKRGMRFDTLKQHNIKAAADTIESRAHHIFGTTRDHVCRGRVFTPAKRIDEVDKLSNKKHAGERDYQAHLSGGCDFEQFTSHLPYWDPKDQRQYLASGNVYICTRSGQVHHCTEEHCQFQEAAPHGESMICALTHKSYGQPLCKFEPKEDEAREGTTSRSMAKGSSFYQYRGGNSAVHEYQGSSGGTAADGTLPRRRALHSTRRKALIREQSNRAQSDLMHGATSCIRPSGHHPHISCFTNTMAKLYPGDVPIEPTNAMRDQYTSIFSTLIYDCTIRKRNMDDLFDAEKLAEAACERIYRECNELHRVRDPFEVMATFQIRIRPYHLRLCSLGVQDLRRDPAVLEYFFETVLMLSRILHYTLHAKRVSGMFKRHAVGLLYVLQLGVSWQVRHDPATGLLERDTARAVMAGESIPIRPSVAFVHSSTSVPPQSARPCWAHLCAQGQTPEQTLPSSSEELSRSVATVCFVPRHAFLDRLPTKSELNQFAAFGHIGSSVINDTLHFVQDCFRSIFDSKHITHLAQLAPYTLESYIQIRHYEKR